MPALVQYPCIRRAPSVMDADAVARFHAVAELEVTGPVKQAAALLSSCMAEGMAYSVRALQSLYGGSRKGQAQIAAAC